MKSARPLEPTVRLLPGVGGAIEHTSVDEGVTHARRMLRHSKAVREVALGIKIDHEGAHPRSGRLPPAKVSCQSVLAVPPCLTGLQRGRHGPLLPLY